MLEAIPTLPTTENNGLTEPLSSNVPLQVGLALGGGGVSGSAAIGVIQALQEAGIEVTHIAGTSSGSMVAALYACGLTIDQMKEAIPRFTKGHLDVDWRGILARIFKQKPYLDGWIKGEKLRRLLDEMTCSKVFSGLEIPCGIVATDLRKGEPFIFSNMPVPGFRHSMEGSVAEAVIASSSIPVIFQPVRRAGVVLGDGGVAMNCPVRVVRALGAKKVIAVDTVTAFANDDVGSLRSGLSIFIHTINLSLRNQMAHEHVHAEFSLYPHVGYVGVFDFHKVNQCVEAGYKYTHERIEQIKQVLL